MGFDNLGRLRCITCAGFMIKISCETLRSRENLVPRFQVIIPPCQPHNPNSKCLSCIKYVISKFFFGQKSVTTLFSLDIQSHEVRYLQFQEGKIDAIQMNHVCKDDIKN